MKSALLGVFTIVLLVTNGSEANAQSGRRSANPGHTPFKHATIEAGWNSAISAQKPMLVMFTTDGCVYCRKMEAETFQHPAIQKMLNENTETVLANARDYRGLVKKLGVRGYPSTLLVSPQGEVLDFMEGFVDPKSFAQRIYPLLTKQTARTGNVHTTMAAHTADR